MSNLYEFRKVMEKAFSPDDVDNMKEIMDNMGFFDAPASTCFHGSYPGGLLDHCLAVTKALEELTEKLSLKWDDPRSPYLVGMLHDLCKSDAYIIREDGKIAKNPDIALAGHGDKSVILAQHVLAALGEHLTSEELLCIRWHMGAFDERENWKLYNKAVEKYPNVLYTHTADMIASQIEGI